jgi:hypothetical protein
MFSSIWRCERLSGKRIFCSIPPCLECSAKLSSLLRAYGEDPLSRPISGTVRRRLSLALSQLSSRVWRWRTEEQRNAGICFPGGGGNILCLLHTSSDHKADITRISTYIEYVSDGNLKQAFYQIFTEPFHSNLNPFLHPKGRYRPWLLWDLLYTTCLKQNIAGFLSNCSFLYY